MIPGQSHSSLGNMAARANEPVPQNGTGLRIAIVGGGHVGLVSGVAFAAVGNRVGILDIDRERIEALARGRVPFVEPGLDALLTDQLRLGTLSLHVDPSEAIPGADLIFICVDTPNSGDGSVDLTAMVSAARTIGRHITPGSLVLNRSTAPIGASQYVRSIVEEEAKGPVSVGVNPEFLAEGTAVRDFFVPDRVVFGVSDTTSLDLLMRAYGPILDRRLPEDLPAAIRERADLADGPVPVVTMDPSTAELSKYAANAFLAVKISFINEIAAIAEELGADVERIAQAVGLDRRIGPLFLRAGIGWGGSCFPKDVLALQGMAETRGLSPMMLRAANEVNHHQQRWVVRQLQRHLRSLVGRRIGLLGLSFKPGTDDLRNAPALEIAAELTRLGARVRAFDPVVTEVPGHLGGSLELMEGVESVARDAEALVLVTEWPQFAEMDPNELLHLVRVPLMLDGRNFLDPERYQSAGFVYVGVGRGEHGAAVDMPDRVADGNGQPVLASTSVSEDARPR
jgi:UDPglucose 6-dehydrogenase